MAILFLILNDVDLMSKERALFSDSLHSKKGHRKAATCEYSVTLLCRWSSSRCSLAADQGTGVKLGQSTLGGLQGRMVFDLEIQ